MTYIKQLDSLRAIAVILVIINHWLPASHFFNKIPNGAIGVDIFFVLSGFLISKILLDSRNNADLFNIPKSSLIKNFYARRTLRIFPIYYLTIFTLLLFSKNTDTNIASSFIYFATYTSNFYFFNINEWDGMVSHLWSLAVEEQFYIFWPWIIFFVRKKYLIHLICGLIVIGISSQVLLREMEMSPILTFTCFDAFGFGALIAWQITFGNQNLKRFYQAASIFAALAVVLFILGLKQQEWNFIPLRTIISLMTLWTITYIVINGERKNLKFKFILNNKGLMFLGRISYGLYLYHNIIPTFNLKVLNTFINPLLPDVVNKTYWDQLILVENIGLLIFISWLSYVTIEKRFLNLKKHFPYQQIKTLDSNAAARPVRHI